MKYEKKNKQAGVKLRVCYRTHIHVLHLIYIHLKKTSDGMRKHQPENIRARCQRKPMLMMIILQ